MESPFLPRPSRVKGQGPWTPKKSEDSFGQTYASPATTSPTRGFTKKSWIFRAFLAALVWLPLIAPTKSNANEACLGCHKGHAGILEGPIAKRNEEKMDLQSLREGRSKIFRRPLQRLPCPRMP